jgi:hypothetical protein
MQNFMRLIFLAVLVLHPISSYASAPFCAEATGMPPQCYYYDASQCRADASKMGGACRVNVETVSLPEGYGNFCLVYSATVSECLYLDFASCETEARQKEGICVRNYTKPQPPPYFEINDQEAYQSF